MRENQVRDFKSQVENTEKRFDGLLKALGGFEDDDSRAFDLSAIIPGTDSSISDVRARHAAINGLVKKMDNKGAALAPNSFFVAASNSLRSFNNSMDQIETEIKNFSSWQGLQSINYDNFLATAKSGSQRDLATPLKTFFDGSESFLEDFQDLFQAINPSRAAFNFSSAAESLGAIIRQASEDRRDLTKSLIRARDALGEIEDARNNLSSLAETASNEASTITQDLGRSNEAAGQIETLRTRAVEIASEAKTLETRVSGFGKQFTDFEDRLEEREKRLAKGNEDLDILMAELLDQKEQIKAIIEQSDSMLSAATVAGLSSEFKSIKDDLTVQLEKAYKTFGWSIVFLFISAIPLILFIFAPFIAPLLSDDTNVIASIAATGNERSGWQYVGQVIARFVILLPAIWFVTFATSRYNSLFKLREHYAYKYSMAMAVDGFKKQSPGHEDLIAALVFEQLAFNPADKLGMRKSDGETSPNPAMNLLLELLRKRVDKDTEG